ncbi:MAG: S24/S26 family peptidase [Lachnospiraceae bacterium]|nr:S24/S26 family peptidase [Lachnospiraceae bacterium]
MVSKTGDLSIIGTDLEKILAEGNAVRVKPQGFSMYPIVVPGRDEVIIEPIENKKLKRGDVALYRREGSILVLHRIWKRRGDDFYFVGDNQTEVEGPLPLTQIKGVMVFLIRKGKEIPVTHPGYVLLTRGWLFLRPFRQPIKKVAKFFKNRKSGN